ncbi:putative LRR receptor-like serine/threonine-protein kinase [Gossypium australe]|uniref:Putative LRR receptor-like serine/threonine-protein kinase n=1 Tax=Gossypium australe TaxID=47621 RepID=A0A5B6W3U4_9ROSI|nr:putative LRR receptor-like serine/threonine-protein kinase [Gossypium australe]
MLRLWLPDDKLKRIVSIPPPHPGDGEDRIIWARSGTGSFSIRSAYWTLKENSWRPKDDNWKVVWKYQGPQRVRIFLWLVANQRLLTNSERSRRGIAHSIACPRCGHNPKDIMHVLRDCLMARDTWMLVVPPEEQSRAVARISENAAVGGMVRDWNGNWILGYTHYLGRCSPLEAELWGVLDGVLILLNKGYKKVKIQTDNLEVVRTLTMKDTIDSGNTLLRRIKRLMNSKGQWEIKYVPKEGNLTADQLAKIGLSWQTSLRVFEVPPDVVDTDFLQDKDCNRSKMGNEVYGTVCKATLNIHGRKRSRESGVGKEYRDEMEDLSMDLVDGKKRQRVNLEVGNT